MYRDAAWWSKFELLRSTIMLSRYVNVFTCSGDSPWSVIQLVSFVFASQDFLFSLYMLRPIVSEAAATLTVFTCVCLCVWDRRSRSYVKSKLSSYIRAIHRISRLFWDVEVFIRRKRKRERRQPCLTPVLTWDASANCPPCMTFSVAHRKNSVWCLRSP